FVQRGARGVGGCCGTTPDHIRDIARSIRPLTGTQAAHRMLSAAPQVELAPRPPAAGKSRFAARLASGTWVTSVEITPPRGWDLAATVAGARACREAGVDAINIPDGPRASARLSPLITAQAIERDAGIEAVLHFCCRDKSLIGMQADLLGCAAAGIRNILFITGDPPKLGDFPFSTAVFDADSIAMARIQDRMNRGVDIGGKRLDPPTSVLIGVGADPNAIDMKRELRRTREKVEAGAEFIITQPVFAVEPLLRFLEAIGDLRVPVLAGIWPLSSLRNAEFMRNEVPGVVVPDEVMARMAAATDREGQRRAGVALARESVRRLRGAVAGVQVSAPFGHVATALAVLEAGSD
ncbi:MAG: bifunctional homocysteine S-methyltransferase/methylenetetrahydrofolate reductase, partial [Lentisphaerae bacterium]|nr:bifunctional homocysteine S-methyltransferase/methylenetetrahydrofolate reductase [Lentisphaerota bacterium]